jgi:hypothetical protein
LEIFSNNGAELFGVTFPDFCQNLQQYIDDGTLVPGWHGGPYFHIAGISRHVSATNLQCLIPPGSLTKAMYLCNPDRSIWFDSYKEEYRGLQSNDTFDVISEDEYIRLCKLNGLKVQASLPDDELTIVKPPVGCSLSCPRTYWQLKKSLYTRPFM